MTAFTIFVLEGGKSPLTWGLASTQGRRAGMEDAHAVVPNLDPSELRVPTAFFGIFDGHGGREVAQFCSEHMPRKVLQASAYSHGDLEKALSQAFLSTDDQIKNDANTRIELYAIRTNQPIEAVRHDKAARENVPKGGSTAVIVLVRPGRLVVGHVGDSRCVLSRGGKAINITRDHKPQDPGEARRVYDAGGFVAHPHGTARVGGTLAMTRAIGDLRYKANEDLSPEQQAVTADPDTVELPLTDDCEFMVLACDGVWDVMSGDLVVRTVSESLAAGEGLGDVCKTVVTHCLDYKHGEGPSMDNITLMLVMFGTDVKVAGEKQVAAREQDGV